MSQSQANFKMNCRICDSKNVELFLDLTDQPHCNRLVPPSKLAGQDPRFPLRVGFCHDCSLVQIDHTIPKEDMFSDYPYVSGTTKTLVEHFKKTAERLANSYQLTSKDLVVDIGSNDGSWLKGYQPLGIRVLGVEPASNVVEIARKNGVPTEHRFFNLETAAHVLAKEGPASLITASGVFFHLEELHSVTKGIKHLLGPKGVFAVQAIYLGGMVQNNAFDQVYHEHLCYYTFKSLKALLNRHGLECFHVHLEDIHGGSLEVHAGHPGAHPIDATVAAFEAQERAQGLEKFSTYQKFAENVWKLKRELLTVLSGFKAAGKTVYSYAAPAKGATLLNSFGIGTDLVQKAVERNPLKFGFAIPGCRIPILDEAKTERPSAYLLLAWNFLPEILRKEKDFLEQGGVFIVPGEEVRQISRETLRVEKFETTQNRPTTSL